MKCESSVHGKTTHDLPAQWEVAYFDPKGCGCAPDKPYKYFCTACIGQIFKSANGNSRCRRCNTRNPTTGAIRHVMRMN